MDISTLRGARATGLGLAANPDQNRKCVRRAIESGINFLFSYSAGQKSFVDALRTVAREHREDVILASGSGSRTTRGLRTARRKISTAIDVEVLDIFFAEYVNPDDDPSDIFGPGGVLDELQKWKHDGAIRYVGASAHDRSLAKRLAEDSRVDVLMHRFNMAHRKAAREVFPAAEKSHTPVVAFTATRWGTLLKPRPDWPHQPPSAADCYRYCLAHSAVQIVLTAPKTVAELDENLRAMSLPPMNGDARKHWEQFGDVVYNSGGGKADAYESRWP